MVILFYKMGSYISRCVKFKKKATFSSTYDAFHEKTDLKILVVVIPKEGWARVPAPVLLLV